MCLMSNKRFEVYVISFCGFSYHVKLGHLDEFVALHRLVLGCDEVKVYDIVYDSSTNYSHPYEWYRKI